MLYAIEEKKKIEKDEEIKNITIEEKHKNNNINNLEKHTLKKAHIQDDELKQNNNNLNKNDELNIIPLDINNNLFPFKKNDKLNIIKEELLISLEKYLQELEIQDTFFNIKQDDEIDEAFSSLNNYMKNDLINFLNSKKDEFIKAIDKEYQNKKVFFEENIIKNIIKKENISSIYNNQIENLINNLKTKNIFSIDYITILVAGKVGVGKTTLISAMIEKDMSYYRLFLDARPYRIYRGENDLAFLNMIDTRIFELFPYDKSKNIFNIIHKMKLESIESNNYNKNVQCIYYCICGYLHEFDIEKINKIKNNKESIPVIIINTFAIEKDQIEKVEHLVKEKLNLPLINVLAKNCKYLNSYGLNDLLKLTLDVCSKYKNENLFNSIKKKICELINIQILEKTKNAKYNIIINIVKKFINFKNIVENKYLIELIYSYLEICFIEYINSLKGDVKELINEIKKLNSLNNFIQEYIEYYKILTNKIIEPILDNKSINFYDMQAKHEKKYSKSIKKENKNDKVKFKEIIKNFLENNFYYISQKYLIYKLIEDFFIPFAEALEKTINEIIYEQSKDLIKKIYDSVFDEFRLNVYKKFVNGKIYKENVDD